MGSGTKSASMTGGRSGWTDGRRTGPAWTDGRVGTEDTLDAAAGHYLGEDQRKPPLSFSDVSEETMSSLRSG